MPAAQKRNPTARRSPERFAAPPQPQKPSQAAATAGGFSVVAAPPAAPDSPPVGSQLADSTHADSYRAVVHDDALHQTAVLREAARSFSSPQPSSATREGAQSRREARHRARGAHRPLRVAWTHFVCGAALLGQLTLLLWLHGRALSASHRADKLDVKIAAKQNLIERTQERIASLDASPQLSQWAKERGWRLADHSDFDDVTKVLSSPPNASPSPNAPTNGTGADDSAQAAPPAAEPSTAGPSAKDKATPDMTQSTLDGDVTVGATPQTPVKSQMTNLTSSNLFVGEAP